MPTNLEKVQADKAALEAKLAITRNPADKADLLDQIEQYQSVEDIYTTSVTFAGPITITGNLIVQGDFSVDGSTLSNMVVEDPLILLAKNVTGAPSYDAGFVVERGTSANVALIWDESDDEFAFINTTETGTTAGNVTISSYANFHIGGAIVDTIDLIPSANVDAIDVTGTNITTASVLDANMSASVSGQIVDITLDTSTIQADADIIRILDSRNHDDAAADAYRGVTVEMSGNWPGAAASTTYLVNAEYSGTINNSSTLYAIRGDLSTATLTGGTYGAAYFSDTSNVVIVADGTNVIGITPGATNDSIDITSTATTSGSIIDVNLGTAAIDANHTVVDIAQSSNHDDAAADNLRGVYVNWSGNLPGTNATTTLSLVDAVYSGTTGASGANGVVYAVRGDISGATLTAGITAAGYFADAARTLTVCNGQYTLTDGTFTLDANQDINGLRYVTSETLNANPTTNVRAFYCSAAGTITTQAILSSATQTAKVSGALIDFDLQTSTIQGNSNLVEITDQRSHDNLAADAYRGYHIVQSGDFAGAFASTAYLVNAEYTGTINNSAILYAVRGDLSGATLTGGTYAGAYFSDGTRTVTLADGTNALTTSQTVSAGTLTDGTASLNSGSYTGLVDITFSGNLTDGTATWAGATQIVTGLASLTSTTLTDGAFSVTAGAFTSVASITDGTASWAGNSLSGFTSISGTTLTDGTASISAGSATGVNGITFSGNLTDGTATWTGTTQTVTGLASLTSTTITDGTCSVTGGAFTGVVSVTDGTASWTGSDLTGFGSFSGSEVDLIPASNVDAIDVTGTNLTTGSVLDANLSAHISGQILDITLDTTTIQAETDIIRITDSRNHDDGSNDAYRGTTVESSGNWPGSNASTTYLINAEYSGTTGASGGNATVYGIRSDISGATLTAGTTAAAYFNDGTNNLTICNGSTGLVLNENNKVSGVSLDIDLGSTTLTASTTLVDIDVSSGHDGLAADILEGVSVYWSGSLPNGTGNATLELFDSVYAAQLGNSGAQGGNVSCYKADLTGAAIDGSNATMYGFNVDTTGLTNVSANEVSAIKATLDPTARAISIDAGTTSHTGAEIIYADVNVNSANVDVIEFDIDVNTALSSAETVNGININIDGHTSDASDSVMNGIYLTSANTTGGYNTGINIDGTWDNAIDATGWISGDFFAQNKYYWCEDFNEEAAAVQLGSGLRADEWTTSGTNSAAAHFTYITSPGGALQIQTAGADNDSDCALHLLTSLNITNNPIIEVRFKTDNVSAAQNCVYVGLSEAAWVDKANIEATANDFILVGIDSDNGHGFGANQLVLVSDDNGGGPITGTIEDMGVTLSANTYCTVRIDCTDTEQPRIWINNTGGAITPAHEIAAASITGTIQAGVAVAPVLFVQTLDSTPSNATLTVDYVKVWQDRG